MLSHNYLPLPTPNHVQLCVQSNQNLTSDERIYNGYVQMLYTELKKATNYPIVLKFSNHLCGGNYNHTMYSKFKTNVGNIYKITETEQTYEHIDISNDIEPIKEKILSIYLE